MLSYQTLLRARKDLRLWYQLLSEAEIGEKLSLEFLQLLNSVEVVVRLLLFFGQNRAG